MSDQRAALYDALAETLAEPPPWLALPGREWPLTQAALGLASRSQAAETAAEALSLIPAEPEAARRSRYRRLFAGPGRPKFWLYESMWRGGHFLGPEMVALERIYATAGVQVAGAEAADHAAIELAFLAYLAGRQAAEPEETAGWRRLERSFIKLYAGQWLPELGRALAASGDAVYAPIGVLLANWLLESGRRRSRNRKQVTDSPRPAIADEDVCTLCGFCVQVCPVRALVMRETAHDTSLWLSAAPCNGCSKCIHVCPAGALQMYVVADKHPLPDAPTVLRRSPRVHCPGCGAATVSLAELEFVAAQIGRPGWLTYCASCRSEMAARQ